jgi:peptide/nickel transport system ATP-binding protein
MSDSRQPALVVEGLRIETAGGADIVDEVSFAVAAGNVLALVGESGCGKTSTALALLGHARPGTRIASGSVHLAGRDLLQVSPAVRRRARGSQIAYVPQDPTSSLNPRHRIGAQIAEVLAVHGIESTAIGSIVADLARRVGIDDDQAFLRRYPFQLSGGQQQRVAIAMALACRPLVVVLDEPTTGLDVTTQARVLDLLADLGHQRLPVYVTHDLAVVDAIATEVAVMYAGRIVEVGPREEVLYRPTHPYTALLLDSVPRLAVRSHLTGIAGTAPAPRLRPAGCFFAPRCPVAADTCHVTFPPVTQVEQGHSVRCWHAGQRPTSAHAPASGNRPWLTSPTILLSVEGLIVTYGRSKTRRTVIRGITFDLRRGECLGVVGESGSGKSTIAR